MRRRIRDIFSVICRTETGHKFRGEFGDPNASPRPRKEIQNLPHRTLTVRRGAVVMDGDLISADGHRFILAGQHQMRDIRKYLALEVNAEVRWERSAAEIDPVTRMPRGGSNKTLSPALPVAREPRGWMEEEKFEVDTYRMFTAADVREGDRLDGLKVMRATDLFGLRMVECG